MAQISMFKIIFLLALPLATSFKAPAQLKQIERPGIQANKNNSLIITQRSKSWNKRSKFHEVEKRVSIKLTNATFSQIWKIFFIQTRLSSTIADNVFSLDKKIDIDLEDATVIQFLDFLSRNLPITYTYSNQYVVVSLGQPVKRSISGTITDILN